MALKSIIIFCLIKICLATAEMKDSCDCCCAIDHLCHDAVVKVKCQKTCAPIPTSTEKPIKDELNDILRDSGAMLGFAVSHFGNGTIKDCTLNGTTYPSGQEFHVMKCKMCYCFGDNYATQSSCRDIKNCTK